MLENSYENQSTEYLLSLVNSSGNDKNFFRPVINVLIERWWIGLEPTCKSKLKDEDAVAEVCLWFCEEIKANLINKKLQYQSEQQLWQWLHQKLNWRILDYWRKHKKVFNEIFFDPLNEIEEFIGVDDKNQSQAECEQICFLVQVGEKHLNKEQNNLLRHRLLGESPNPEWTQCWIDTNWNRIKNILLKTAKVGFD